MNALEIARAACMEVGADPYDVWWSDELGCLFAGPSRDALRACWLAEMAVFGPLYMTHCHYCFSHRLCTPDDACTTVRDALRGVTCS